jgi:ribose/xylose/arabinose/galactoside ABC-type transport system permease subunit
MIKRLKFANAGLVIFYLVVLLIFSLLSPTFRTGGNIQNLLTGFSHIGIMAIGVTFPILLGGIDLSVGAIMSLVGMVAFDLILIFGLPGWLVIPLALLVGALAGWLNGFLVVKFRLNPFIATLATMTAYRGATYAISGRQIFPELGTQAITDPIYRAIDGMIGPIPLAFIYLILIMLLTHFLLRYTRLGMDMLAVGGNEHAARLAGINLTRVKLLAYSLSGLCTAIAALLLTSRLTTATESLGFGFELSAIAAAIIGGVSLQGGIGNTFGPALGAFLIGTIYIGMTLLGVTTYAQPVIAGGILMGAVGYDQFMKVRREQEWLKRQHVQVSKGAG